MVGRVFSIHFIQNLFSLGYFRAGGRQWAPAGLAERFRSLIQVARRSRAATLTQTDPWLQGRLEQIYQL